MCFWYIIILLFTPKHSHSVRLQGLSRNSPQKLTRVEVPFISKLQYNKMFCWYLMCSLSPSQLTLTVLLLRIYNLDPEHRLRVWSTAVEMLSGQIKITTTELWSAHHPLWLVSGPAGDRLLLLFGGCGQIHSLSYHRCGIGTACNRIHCKESGSVT